MEVVDERGIPRSRLPIEERWSARFFELDQVFYDLDLNDANLVDVEYANVGSWSEYRSFMGSEISKDIKRPPKELYSYREFNPVAKDID